MSKKSLQHCCNTSEALVLIVPAEQPELARVARGLGEAEMLEGVRGQQPSARGALDEALLDQKRLDDVLDGVAFKSWAMEKKG